MTRLVLRIALIAAAVLSAADLAAAQSGTAEEQRICNLDARRHCREVMSQGDMAVLACLRQHRGKLTRACDAVLRKHGQ
jgi:hypothetical protein